MENIRTFFLRVSARCNLNCNYCYVFKHKDKSWKKLPPKMSKNNLILFANRLKDYVKKKEIHEVYIIFHGGEPLLIGESLLIEYADIISEILQGIVKIDFSIQTNGTLLNENFLKEANRRKIKISLSIDGPKDIHNKNRFFQNGIGSYDKVIQAIYKLQEYPQLFQGVIGVIDPHANIDLLFNFFEKNGLCDIDLLLPDANYDSPPIYREAFPGIYVNWLKKAFDTWFDRYHGISFKTFENILDSISGINSPSDFFGFGELSYLTIETDGSYHTTDILKVAYENASAIGLSIENNEIDGAINHKKVDDYNNYLKDENLPQKCKLCEVKKICGGGSLPHRYSRSNGFNNPTIYCEEMFELIKHAEEKLYSQVAKEIAREKSKVMN